MVGSDHTHQSLGVMRLILGVTLAGSPAMIGRRGAWLAMEMGATGLTVLSTHLLILLFFLGKLAIG